MDGPRCRREFRDAMIEDLRWFGLAWQEGPDAGGPFAPYSQSERLPLYRAAFNALRDGNFLFTCCCSRRDIRNALSAPHPSDEEPCYPGTCRRRTQTDVTRPAGAAPDAWRFRVPDGESIVFNDGRHGRCEFVAGRDFGDFVVWRGDDLPSYQLACVVDDAAMGITEVVRGADLLVSTARQILLYRALGLRAPAFYHCPLVTDEHGTRLAKRHDAVSLRTLRHKGLSPEQLRAGGDGTLSIGLLFEC
jgi:glutamyl-tRNA synthetase